MNDDKGKTEEKKGKSRGFWVLALGLWLMLGVVAIAVAADHEEQSAELDVYNDKLVTGLNNNGWELYTTSVCPHCNEQKEIIGDAVNELDMYVCDTSQENSDRCRAANITYVPAWINTETGEEIIGVQDLQALEIMAEG